MSEINIGTAGILLFIGIRVDGTAGQGVLGAGANNLNCWCCCGYGHYPLPLLMSDFVHIRSTQGGRSMDYERSGASIPYPYAQVIPACLHAQTSMTNANQPWGTAWKTS